MRNKCLLFNHQDLGLFVLQHSLSQRWLISDTTTILENLSITFPYAFVFPLHQNLKLHIKSKITNTSQFFTWLFLISLFSVLLLLPTHAHLVIYLVYGDGPLTLLPPFSFYLPTYALCGIPSMIDWNKTVVTSHTCLNFFTASHCLQNQVRPLSSAKKTAFEQASVYSLFFLSCLLAPAWLPTSHSSGARPLELLTRKCMCQLGTSAPSFLYFESSQLNL